MLPKGTRGGALYAGADGSALTSEEGLKGQVGAIADALPKAGDEAAAKKKLPVDFGLFVVLALWYLGNYYYNITNKLALNAAGGAAGFPMTIATLQFGVGALYAIFLWLAPDARETPKISFKDWVKMGPVSIANTGAHAASVFALSAGSVSFAQIVKAAEPAFAAVIGTTVYKTKVSKAKWLALIPVIGGVCLASLGELNFAWAALITAGIANIFAAIKGNENKKLMETPGLKDRIGTVGNQFALTTITSFLFALPLMLIMEGHKLGEFFTLATTTPAVLNNLVLSGLWFYSYNELATIVAKKTNAVTQSVANTAKRVIVIVVVALVMGEGLSPLKLAGSTIGIAGVFLYSIIDKLVESRKEKKSLVV
uniref:Plastid triose phosphate-phosphate translocator n=1 Tax=Dinophysis acuminata TaxID=47934 RepID=D9I8K7_DINAC|nr:plastid triose phosphate-phosphate translocator [Dinophysis acuminata]